MLTDPQRFRVIVITLVLILFAVGTVFLLTRERPGPPLEQTDNIKVRQQQDGTTVISIEGTTEEDPQQTLELLNSYLEQEYGSIEDIPDDVVLDVPGVLLGPNPVEEQFQQETDRLIQEKNERRRRIFN